MRTSDFILFDTNILIYIQDKNSQFFHEAFKLHQDVLMGKIVGCITLQNLSEFISVITNPRRVPKALSLMQAKKEVSKYLNSGVFKVIVQNTVTPEVFRLLLKNWQPKTTSQIFDLQLVSTMLSNGVNQIITNNPKDFDQIPGLNVFGLDQPKF